MGVAKLLLMLCSISLVCVLVARTSSFLSLSHVVTNTCYFSALRSWPPKAKLTPPLLFLLLNLVVGALLVTNSSFLRRLKDQHKMLAQESDGDLHLQGAIINGGRSSSFRKKATTQSTLLPGSLPQAPITKQLSSAHLKQLNRSKSDKLMQVPSRNMALTSAGAETLSAQAQINPPLDQSAARKKKKKKRRSASSGFEDAAMNESGLKKAASAPPLVASKNGDGNGDGEGAEADEVNRRAEEFIGKFYMQMRMQRLASLERHRHSRGSRGSGSAPLN